MAVHVPAEVHLAEQSIGAKKGVTGNDHCRLPRDGGRRALQLCRQNGVRGLYANVIRAGLRSRVDASTVRGGHSALLACAGTRLLQNFGKAMPVIQYGRHVCSRITCSGS